MTHKDELSKIDWWELLWKVNQIIIPVGLAWGIWVTSNIFELKSQQIREEDKFNKSDSQVLELGIKDWVRANYPTPEQKSQLKDIELSIKSIDAQLEALRLDVARQQINDSIKKGNK
jgi:hypothetical protein